MPILVLPLLIPGVILATMAAQNMQYIWILLAITILNLPISLFFTRLVLTDVIKYDS
jgi:ABC-type transport system involved in cytochrome c biogenesis permease component